ncbi:hypothetical protein HHK36_000458 [Tetracentron sinense]|uniref:Uncharacterized protein n=1 Tax=Tetracentron sinense TaxID=13715 RepID=A0A834ZWF1_TETSI|nr:hypothetical protein HHK36_000458 [Tetracentron sinense]
MDDMACAQVPPVVRKEKKKQAKDVLNRQKQAEKKKRPLEIALTTSAAIISELEKKKQKKIEEQQRLNEEGAAIAEAVALCVLLGEGSDDSCKIVLMKGSTIWIVVAILASLWENGDQRFLIMSSLSRKNKWQQPKKIEQVHRDAAREQASRLGRGSVVRFDLRGSTLLSSPNAQLGGFSEVPSQVSGSAQDVGLEDRHSYKSRTLSVPLLQRPIEDDSVALAPQGGLARRMSIGGQPQVSSVPVADISLSPGDAGRTAAVPNGYSSMSELAFFLGAIYLFYLFLFSFL